MVICHIHTRSNFFSFFYGLHEYGLGIEKRKNHSKRSGFFCIIWGNELLCVGWAIKTVGKTLFLKLNFPVQH